MGCTGFYICRLIMSINIHVFQLCHISMCWIPSPYNQSLSNTVYGHTINSEGYPWGLGWVRNSEVHGGQELYTTTTIDCDIIFQVNDSRYQIRLIARTEPEPLQPYLSVQNVTWWLRKSELLCPISTSVSCNN